MAGIRGINLLSGEERILKKRAVSLRAKELGKWLVLITIFYSIFVAIVFAVGMYLSFQINSIKGKASSLEEKIKSEQKKESLELAIKERVKEIAKILGSRIEYSVLVNKILSLAPSSDVVFQEIDFSKGKIKFSGQAANLIAMNNFLDKLLEEEKNSFSYIYLDSFARIKDGSYSFSFEIDFKK